MNWILAAFLEPILYALANVLDSGLTNRLFKSAFLLTILSAFAIVPFLPLVWVLDPPQVPALNIFPFFILVAFIELFYGFPYFKALQHDDTSVAISLFSLGKILVPILAFLFIGELLRPIQYFGFFLIIISSAALTFNPDVKFRLNKSFFYMLLSSSMLAIEVVIYKYIFDQVSWGTGFVWTVGISGLIGLFTLFVPSVRRTIKTELPALKKYYWLILLIGGIGFFGSSGFTYSISQVPATVSRSIGSFQPVFVLLYAIIFKRFFPAGFREEIGIRSLGKKILLFIITIIGVVLTVRY
jgi:drug/metabolite transporter (DMT)-like permease